MITQDPTAAVKNLNDHAAGQLERLLGARSKCNWLHGCESSRLLLQHFQTIENDRALQSTNAGNNLLRGGRMEEISTLSSMGGDTSYDQRIK